MDSKSFTKKKCQIDPNDVDIQYIRGSGSGGQKINKTSSTVQITHLPTGIQFKVQDGRDRSKNEEIAWQRLQEKLDETLSNQHNNSLRFGRCNPNQSEKRRTYKIKDGYVVDHFNETRAELRQIFKGNIDLLHC